MLSLALHYEHQMPFLDITTGVSRDVLFEYLNDSFNEGYAGLRPNDYGDKEILWTLLMKLAPSYDLCWKALMATGTRWPKALNLPKTAFYGYVPLRGKICPFECFFPERLGRF